jgi:processing peptidase subunit beta
MQIMQRLSKYNIDYSHGKINENTSYHLFKRQGQPINISATFAAGARFEKKIGLAHFLEHMLLAGTEKYPNKRLLAIAAENIGGTVGGIVNDDLLTIWFEIAEKKDLDLALELLDQVINHPLFDEQTIETERGAILTEIQTRYHNRAVQVIDLANTLVFQNTPSGKLSLQTEDTIKLVKKSELTDYYQKTFKNSSVSWSIAGDVDEVKITEALNKIHRPLASMEETFN